MSGFVVEICELCVLRVIMSAFVDARSEESKWLRKDSSARQLICGDSDVIIAPPKHCPEKCLRTLGYQSPDSYW